MKKKIIFLICMINIVSILSISLINYIFAIKPLRQEYNNSYNEKVDSMSKDLDMWFALQKDSLDENMNALVYHDDYSRPSIYKFLEPAVARNNGAFMYFVGLDTGEYNNSTNWNPPPTFKGTERPWYKATKTSDDFQISTPYADSQTGNMVITISKKFKNLKGIEGAFGADIRLDFLQDYTKSLNLANNSYMVITDKDGNIISHKNEEYLPKLNGKETVFTNIAQFGDIADKILSDNTYNNFVTNKIKDYDGVTRYVFYSKIQEFGGYILYNVDASVVNGKIVQNLLLQLIISIIILIASIILCYRFISKLGTAFERYSNTITRMSEYDFITPIPQEYVKGNDEISLIFTKFEEMRVSLNSLIHSFKDQSMNVIETSKMLAENCEQGRQVNESIVNAVMQTNELVNSQVKIVEEEKEKIDVMLENIDVLNEDANIMLGFIDNVAENTENGSQSVVELIAQTKKVNDIISHFTDRVQELNEKTKDIKNIMELIQGIAEQTNLLALNAAIEAARAGEAGKGFAVVADEVRKLAENSTQSVNSVSETLKDIQDNSEQMKKYMIDSSKEMEKSNKLAENTQDSINRLKDTNEEFNAKLYSMFEFISNVSGKVNGIKDEFSNILDVSIKLNNQSNITSASAEEQASSIQEISASASTLEQMAVDLEEQLKKFEV